MLYFRNDFFALLRPIKDGFHISFGDFFERVVIADFGRMVKGISKNAVINVAAVGLSLNPATHYAYLVPRGGKICLDISYRGLIKIATDSGSIKWAKAELVYEGDDFEYLGPSTIPNHKQADPFGPHSGTMLGLIGVYCIAKTSEGYFLVEKMSVAELIKIRDEASAAAKKGPWTTYPGEMCKKCVIKRAQKRRRKKKEVSISI